MVFSANFIKFVKAGSFKSKFYQMFTYFHTLQFKEAQKMISFTQFNKTKQIFLQSRYFCISDDYIYSMAYCRFMSCIT